MCCRLCRFQTKNLADMIFHYISEHNYKQHDAEQAGADAYNQWVRSTEFVTRSK